MTVPTWVIILISALTDFFITFGSGLAVSMVAVKGGVEMPTGPEILIATLLGIVAMCKETRSLLKLPTATPPDVGVKP